MIEQVGADKMPVIVFVTAYSHYAVQAFEVHALDYLTKPVEAERLRSTVCRVRESSGNRALITHEQLQSILASLESFGQVRIEHPGRLLIRNGMKDAFVVSDIDRIEAADYYPCLHVGTKSLMFRERLSNSPTRSTQEYSYGFIGLSLST
ncbi:MAG: response regulator receiver protein [Edaphobacter sp.]|nr:response regulator receiver protein [Edaphobacter sp.]